MTRITPIETDEMLVEMEGTRTHLPDQIEHLFSRAGIKRMTQIARMKNIKHGGQQRT